jgi:basic amino acid/polyamine antiporter, APA family
MPTQETPTLARRLGLTTAVMVVIGSTIGSGIFLTPQNVAHAVPVPGLMIFVWVLTGLLTLAGALTNAEVASMLPEAGGQYVFFRVTFGKLTAFLYGWCTFIVYQTGSIAALAVAFARYLGFYVDLPHLGPDLEAWKLPLLGNIYPLKDFGITMVAIGAIILVAFINYFGVHIGGWIQNVFSWLKIAAIGCIVALSFTSSHGSTANFFPIFALPDAMPTMAALMSAVGVAMIATLWSYDGWNSLTFLAGEVKDPQHTIPRALMIGTVMIIVIYVVTNLAYLYVLPIGEMGSSKLVAADAMEKIGKGYGAIIAAMVMLSTFGTVNATTMTTARVYYAMAKDKLFFRGLGEIHPKYRTPGTSLIIQAAWACLLTLTGTYDQIFTYVVFAGWIFYALGAGSVFILRVKQPDAERPYRVPGYPWVPILFIIVATWFVINTIVHQTADSVVGLLLLAAGIPFYLLWNSQNMKAAAAKK